MAKGGETPLGLWGR